MKLYPPFIRHINVKVRTVNRNKDNKLNIRAIFLAVIGLILLTLYFFLVTRSPTVQLLKPHISKEKILSRAESFFQQLLSDPEQYQREVAVKIDANLLRYVQFYKKKEGKFPDIQIASWRISWKGPISNPNNEKAEGKISNIFEIAFDFNGDLQGFKIKQKNLVLNDDSSFSEDEAEMEAKFFLESMNIKTKNLITTNKEIKSTDKNTTYQFTLKNKETLYPYITDTYSFEFFGSRIVSYWWNRKVDPEAGAIPKYKKEKMISDIMMAVIWLSIIGIITVLFIRKLRKDELEFKRGVWIGIFLATIAFIRIIIIRNGQIEDLIQAIVSGVFIFLGFLILFPVSDSCCRQTWPEKLRTLDLFFQGKGIVRETGNAILQSFFLTGLSTFLFGFFIFATTSLNLGYLIVPANTVNNFLEISTSISFAGKNFISGIFLGFLFLVFWPAYLKGKIPGKHLLFSIVMIISLNLTGLNYLFFNPPYLGFFLLLPLTAVWVYFIRKWDIMTILLSLLGMFFFLGLLLMPVLPETLFSPQSAALIVIIALFFLLGVYLVNRPYSAEDYDKYIPEYVSRIAERERFLKELEIARGVQMRFLPQKVPEFPSLEIVSLCQPAMEVGGDYYDFIQMDNRYISVLIGDVSGKGVSAAFYMTMVKGIIKTLSKKINQPAILLAEANEIFYENAPRNVFITIIYGIFDLREQILTVASAGHNPLIIRRYRIGETQWINPKGLALGLERGDHYKQTIAEISIPIEENDVIVFYTDGVTEAMNTKGEVFGEERLKKIVESSALLSPQDLQQKILKEVQKFSGKAPQHDDFTTVVVKVRQKTK